MRLPGDIVFRAECFPQRPDCQCPFGEAYQSSRRLWSRHNQSLATRKGAVELVRNSCLEHAVPEVFVQMKSLGYDVLGRCRLGRVLDFNG